MVTAFSVFDLGSSKCGENETHYRIMYVPKVIMSLDSLLSIFNLSMWIILHFEIIHGFKNEYLIYACVCVQW